MNSDQKLYQVFVSSTMDDLQEERNQVFDALLKSNCIPVGMEHFPSSNKQSLELIAKFISQCDYFLTISAGKYGSLIPDKSTGYVEWEFEYAKDRLPSFAFLYEDLGKLPGEQLEGTQRRRLEAFRRRLKDSGKNVAFYSSAHDLNAKVLHAFQRAPVDIPAIGWIRARREPCPHSNELVGTWRLVHSNNPDWNASTIIKMFSEQEFVWLKTDANQKKPSACILGTYECGPYMEDIYEVPRLTWPHMPRIVGQSQEYEIEIDDDVLKTTGVRSTGRHVQEEFHRLIWMDESE